MRIAVFSAHRFEIEYLKKANKDQHELLFIDAALSEHTAVLAKGCDVVSIFANDDASAPVLSKLAAFGIHFIALRSAGFNHVDINKAKALNIRLANVPAYSPYAVAEHTVALMLALNRKIIKAHRRVEELNFSLDGLVGFDMHGKTVGVIGTGKIGGKVAKIMGGFGCEILAYDKEHDEELIKETNIMYTDLNYLCQHADIITLHIPLNEHTHYIIDEKEISIMKKGVMLINTSRGGLLNTKAVIKALKSCHIGYLGLDVYEEEKGLFFQDHSEDILQDDVLARLLTFPNVLITSHQGFLTTTALANIADTVFVNIDYWSKGELSKYELY